MSTPSATKKTIQSMRSNPLSPPTRVTIGRPQSTTAPSTVASSSSSQRQQRSSPQQPLKLFGNPAPPNAFSQLPPAPCSSSAASAAASSNSSSAASIQLGGAWHELEKQRLSLLTEKHALQEVTRRALHSSDRSSMLAEDLLSQSVRYEVRLSKYKCADIILESKLDDAVNENEQLRLLHRAAVTDLEISRSLNASLEARVAAREAVAARVSEAQVRTVEKLEVSVTAHEESDLQLQKALHSVKKLQLSLAEANKQSSLYQKLRDDKDGHIAVLVKEKNRMHDALQEMAKKNAQTSRTLALSDKLQGPMMTATAAATTTKTLLPGPEAASPVPENLDDVAVNGGGGDYEQEKALPEPVALFSVSSVPDCTDVDKRDRFLIGTIKKLAKELREKETALDEREREIDKLKMKNDDLVNRIRNSAAVNNTAAKAANAATPEAAAAGVKKALRVTPSSYSGFSGSKNNATPTARKENIASPN